jgi:hypothetical protein
MSFYLSHWEVSMLARLFCSLGVIAGTAFLSLPALAQDEARYQLEKTADGYVRLDKQTGDVSICKEQSGQLVCRAAADDRNSLADEIGRIDSRLASVEKKLESGDTSGFSSNNDLPTEEEFEKTMGYMEKFFRRFMGIVRDLNESENGPQRT